MVTMPKGRSASHANGIFFFFCGILWGLDSSSGFKTNPQSPTWQMMVGHPGIRVLPNTEQKLPRSRPVFHKRIKNNHTTRKMRVLVLIRRSPRSIQTIVLASEMMAMMVRSIVIKEMLHFHLRLTSSSSPSSDERSVGVNGRQT